MAFQAGISGNPNGRPKGGITWQSWRSRIDHLVEEYGIVELLALSKKIAAGGKGVPLSTLDGMVVQTIAGCLQLDGKERERLLDRLFGKAVQRIGGETEGAAIRIAQDTPQIENLPRELREELAMVMRKVMECQNAPALIEQSSLQPETKDENEI